MFRDYKRSGRVSALPNDLSKPLDCIDHESLIAKLYAHGCDMHSFYFIYFYPKGRKQITKTNSFYSVFAEILFGIPQGSILGPLLLNIYICELIFENSDIVIANYIDHNSWYVCTSDLDSVIFNLQRNTKNFFRCFSNI